MSSALFELAAEGRHRALSAGSIADPSGSMHQAVVQVMPELDGVRAGDDQRR